MPPNAMNFRPVGEICTPGAGQAASCLANHLGPDIGSQRHSLRIVVLPRIEQGAAPGEPFERFEVSVTPGPARHRAEIGEQ